MNLSFTSTEDDDKLYYTYDREKLTQLRSDAPWKSDATYFKRVVVSLSALTKMVNMYTHKHTHVSLLFFLVLIFLSLCIAFFLFIITKMTHCASGVEKGIQKGGKPIEVMGLLLGRPWTPPSSSAPENSSSTLSETHTLLVSDVFPLPIEGFETRVVADDINVSNHMIALGESLERQGRTNATSDSPGKGGDERFMGWYHSHPFDYMGETHQGHCYLSNTDVTTQLQWQRMEDPHGNPFVAIVFDPLRSMIRGIPELKAFRAFPPEYSPTVRLPDGSSTMTCPDGRIVFDEKSRLERWGNCWNRYYQLDVDYYMSVHARRILNHWKNKHLWMKHLVPNINPAIEKQMQEKQIQNLSKVADVLSHAHFSTSTQHVMSGGGGGGANKKSSSVQEKSSLQTHPSSLFSASSSCTSCSSIMAALHALRTKQQKQQGQKNASEHAEFDVAYHGLVDHVHDIVQEQLCQVVKDTLFSLE